MKKVKIFFASAALLLMTAGVFAGKAKITTFQLFVGRGSTYYQLDQTAQSALGTGLSTGGTQIQVVGNGLTYGLYYFDASTSAYTAVSSSGW